MLSLPVFVFRLALAPGCLSGVPFRTAFLLQPDLMSVLAVGIPETGTDFGVQQGNRSSAQGTAGRLPFFICSGGRGNVRNMIHESFLLFAGFRSTMGRTGMQMIPPDLVGENGKSGIKRRNPHRLQALIFLAPGVINRIDRPVDNSQGG